MATFDLTLDAPAEIATLKSIVINQMCKAFIATDTSKIYKQFPKLFTFETLKISNLCDIFLLISLNILYGNENFKQITGEEANKKQFSRNML